MSENKETRLDDIDRRILMELQSDARIPFAELGRRVGLSTPAVIERVHRLEDTGVILGYRAQIDGAKIGLPVRAFVKVTVAGDKLFQFASAASRIPEVLECHRVTGAESYIVQIAVEDAAHIERVIDAMMPYVATNTSLVLASPVQSRALVPPSGSRPSAGKSATSGRQNSLKNHRRQRP